MSPSKDFMRGRSASGQGLPVSPVRVGRGRKRWVRRSTRTTLVAVALLGGAIIAHAGWNFLHSDGAFAVREIHVVGLVQHQPQVLRDALADLRGRNLFALKADELSKRFAAFPWLKGFLCRKHLPDTLIVEVVERQELCAVATDKGPFALDGRDMAWPAAPGTPCAFRLEAGVDPGDPRVQATVAELLDLGLQGTVTALALSPVRGALALKSQDGWTLVVEPGDVAAEWRRFQASRAWAAAYAPGQKAADLRWAGKVVFLPATPQGDDGQASPVPAEGGNANG